jgi:hypothetical protein
MINKAIIEWNLGELREDGLCRRGPEPLRQAVRRPPERGADIAKKVLPRQWHDGRSPGQSGEGVRDKGLKC